MANAEELKDKEVKKEEVKKPEIIGIPIVERIVQDSPIYLLVEFAPPSSYILGGKAYSDYRGARFWVVLSPEQGALQQYGNRNKFNLYEINLKDNKLEEIEIPKLLFQEK